MKTFSKIISNVRVGKPHTRPDQPSHVKGVKDGNSPKKVQGFVDLGDRARGSAARSTGINPDHREPIDARMPNLSPA